MFVACGIWCLADVSSVSPSLEVICLSNVVFPVVLVIVKL